MANNKCFNAFQAVLMRSHSLEATSVTTVHKMVLDNGNRFGNVHLRISKCIVLMANDSAFWEAPIYNFSWNSLCSAAQLPLNTVHNSYFK